MSSSTDIVILTDHFAVDCAQGQLEGTMSTSGQTRRVTDLDGVMGIDHGALRFGFPNRAGWARESLAYGPFERSPGLAFGVYLLNGHNSSQALPPPRPSSKRLLRRMFGPLLYRLGLLDAPQNPPLLHHTPALKENLAVGWYAEPAPADPIRDGNGLVVHALGPENGALWACGSGEEPRQVAMGVQNIPLYLVVVLREQGAAYYAAVLSDAHGAAGYPYMRPLAVTEAGTSPLCYAVTTQSTQGEVGFRVESRLYSAGIARVESLTDWYGSAHAAHRGHDPVVAGSTAHQGGVWDRRSTGIGEVCCLYPGKPTGLIYLRPDRGASVLSGAIWRLDAEGACLACVADGLTLRLLACDAGACRTLPDTLQILDDGHEVTCFAGDARMLTYRPGDAAPNGAGVGPVGACTLFEAHPRTVPLPPSLALPPPWQPEERPIRAPRAFDGPAGPLDQAGDWQRSIGRGLFERTGDGCVRVRATRENPVPGRTAYTLSWPDPRFADVETEILPPGSERGQGERGRAGLIFWQDAANYFLINTWLDDQFDGTSVSSFHCLDGKEDPFRAVWTNVGRRIRWGHAYRMRARFDGLTYLVSIDDEPVLLRSLQDIYPHTRSLSINRVGIVANWEWGNDTGSLFTRLTLRS
jgi:hypothetical protein